MIGGGRGAGRDTESRLVFRRRSSTARRLGFIASVAGALAIGACGGDSGDTPIEPPAPTKPLYVSNADAICRTAEAEIRERAAEQIEGLRPDEPLGDRQSAELAEEVVIPIAMRQFEQLRDLPRPEEDRRTLERFFEEAEAALDELRARPELLDDRERVFREAIEVAREYGFADCEGVA